MESRLHKDEITIAPDLVRRLVDSEFPRYAGLTLHRLDASGSSNVQYRLGDDLLVRLPRQPGGGATIAKEHRWLPEIGQHLPVAVPEIIAAGKPACGYSERWSIVRWLPGNLPAACYPEHQPEPERAQLAADLADVILAFRAIEVTRTASEDPQLRLYRGRSLAQYDEQTRHNIEQCRTIKDLDLDLQAALSIWEDALKLPGASEMGPDRWHHSDLVAENLLLTDGRLSGVLDFGGIGVGDPSVDLHGAWELFDPPARDVFRARLGVDNAEWLRGRAWALAIALSTFSYYWTTMPGRIKDRLAMARSVVIDATTGTVTRTSAGTGRIDEDRKN